MDRLDAELVLFRWDQAGDADQMAAARYGVTEISAELTRLEADIPGIAEKVCRGRVAVRDFPYMGGAYQIGEAILSWRRTYPDLAAEWDGLPAGLGRAGLPSRARPGRAMDAASAVRRAPGISASGRSAGRHPPSRGFCG